MICPSGNRTEAFQQIAVLLIVVAGSFKERMQNGKRKVVVIVRERGAIRFRQCSERKAKPPRLSVRALQRELSSTLMKLRHGMDYMNALKSKGSTIKKPIRSTEPAPIGPKSTSAACDALRSAFTTILQVRTSSVMRKKVRGGKITGASRMAIK